MLDQNDLIISTYRKSDNTSSWLYESEICVQVYHKPSGITVRHCNESTQFANKGKAIQKLDLLLLEHNSGLEPDKAELLRKDSTTDISRYESYCMVYLPFTDICIFNSNTYYLGDLEVIKTVYTSYRRYLNIFIKQGLEGLLKEESKKKNRHEQFAYDLLMP